MPPRSLRVVGTRLPNPGAVLKGCPRPKALRFSAPRAGLFGDGRYSGNIMQDGVALQPRDYLLDGVTLLPACIVVDGAATVAPGPETGAAVAMGCNLVVLPGASLTASEHCKGLLLYFSNGILDLGTIHMTALGMGGDFGNLTPINLTPGRLRARLLSRPYHDIVIQGRGAAGAPSRISSVSTYSYSGNPGQAAGPMQTGGGGGGNIANLNVGGLTIAAPGGCGGPCCGGAGSGSVTGNNTGGPAGDFGGPGGAVNTVDPVWSTQAFGMAAGFPPGDGTYGTASLAERHGRSGGGLLGLFAPCVWVKPTGIVASDGGQGGAIITASYGSPGAGAGGGIVIIGTAPGGYTNQGTVRAAGGLAGSGNSYYHAGGPGGAGSVNIFELKK